jgi:hypothetical protein
MRLAASHITLKPAEIDAFAASLCAWAVRFVVWLADSLGPLGAGLRRDLDQRLREAARYAECVVFLHAAWRLRYFRRKPCAFEAQPRGVRATLCRAARRRRYYRIAGLNRGALIERAQRIADLLRAPEAQILRIMRRLCRGRHGIAPQDLLPIVQERRLRASAFNTVLADTS